MWVRRFAANSGKSAYPHDFLAGADFGEIPGSCTQDVWRHKEGEQGPFTPKAPGTAKELEDYYGEFRVASEVGLPALASDCKADFEAKVDAWLQKRAPPKKKLYRKKAHHTLLALDHTLQTPVGVQGLAHFMYFSGSPFVWPSLSISVGQESSNVTALTHVTREMGANLDIAWDPSHACWNDCRRSIKASGDWPFMLSMIMRIMQIRSASTNLEDVQSRVRLVRRVRSLDREGPARAHVVGPRLLAALVA